MNSEHTTKFLVLAAKGVLLLAGLVKLVRDALDLSDLDAEVTLGLLIDLDGFLQAGLDLNVDALQLLGPLLELPSCSIGLLQVNDENFNLKDTENDVRFLELCFRCWTGWIYENVLES